MFQAVVILANCPLGKIYMGWVGRQAENILSRLFLSNYMYKVKEVGTW